MAISARSFAACPWMSPTTKVRTSPDLVVDDDHVLADRVDVRVDAAAVGRVREIRLECLPALEPDHQPDLEALAPRAEVAADAQVHDARDLPLEPAQLFDHALLLLFRCGCGG